MITQLPIASLVLVCTALSACTHLPQTVEAPTGDQLATPTAEVGSTAAALPVPPSASDPVAAAHEAPDSEPEYGETETPVDTKESRSLFASRQQERTYQDSLYHLLLGEMSGFKGQYAQSAESFIEVARRTHQADIAERATQVALFADNMEITQQAASLWLELAPESLEAQQVLTIALMRQNKIEEASQQLDAVLQSNAPEQNETLLTLLKQSGSQATAQQMVEALLKRRPKDADLLYLHARLLLGMEKIPQALSQLELLLKVQPEYEEAVPLYTQLLHQQGEIEQALRFLRHQLSRFPQRDDWRLLYARLLINENQPQLAITQFAQLLSQSPQDSELLYTLGLLYLQTEQPALAQKHLHTLLKLSKEEEQRNAVRYYLGQAAEQAEQPAEAMNWYRQVDAGSHYFNANVRSVLLLLAEKNFSKASALAAEIAPGTPEEEFKLLQLEAEILVREKRYSEAMLLYERGLKSDPENTELLYMHGMLAEKVGRLDLLESDFRRILQLDPDSIETINALGYTLADRTERYEEAYQLIQQAYAKRPEAHYILDSMGWVMYRLQRYAEAESYLRKALHAQDDPEIAAHLGEVLWQAGKQTEARTLLEAAKKRFPDDEILQNTLRKLLK